MSRFKSNRHQGHCIEQVFDYYLSADTSSFEVGFPQTTPSGQTVGVSANLPALPRILTLMGSGETAPTMVSTHRRLAASLANGPATVRSMVNAALLDTPYGFQENASELAERAVNYFSESVDVNLRVSGLTSLQTADPVARERGLELLRTSDYLFAGPGSPTYALREWAQTDVPTIISNKLEHGGIIVFASAAALTIGAKTVPVYEIYKCGHDPHWLDGLNVLGNIGINAVVIPHYDNAEGGHHDTRFCYLGERRLQLMEQELPADHYVLGIDEHTGVIFNLDEGSAEVVGNGMLTVRINGESRTFNSGTTIDIAFLANPENDATSAAKGMTTAAATSTAAPSNDPPADISLAATTDRCIRDFDEAMANADADQALGAVLALEDAITAWSADTLQSDEADRARSTLRSMITRLGDAAVKGLGDPTLVRAPLVEALLEIRALAKGEKRFDLSDLIRDRLDAAEIEVKDTAEGAIWNLRNQS